MSHWLRLEYITLAAWLKSTRIVQSSPSWMCFFESTMYIWCTSSIKYLNSKPKVYMCHFINSRHKSQKCVVFVGDPLLGSLSWWCVWIRFGLPSTPTWTAPQSSRTQTCNSRLGPGQGSHLSAHISSKDKRWKCIGMHHKIVRRHALCPMHDWYGRFSDHLNTLNHIDDMFMNDSWMINEWQSIPSTIARSNRKRFASTTVCHPCSPQTMTLQQIAENFFCAYFFGALPSTEDLPLDFESEDVQMNSQTRMRTVATTNFHQLPFLLLQSFQRIVVLQAGAKCRQGELLIRFLAFQIKRRMGGSGRKPQIPLFSWFSYYPPTFLPRTSTSFGFCKPRVVTLSNVVPSADCQCVTRQALSYGLLVCLWLVASSLTKRCAFVCVCVWSTSVVRGVEMLHASFSPCWLFKLKKYKKVRVPKSSFTVTTWVAYSWCKFWGGLYTSAWHETKLHGNCMIYQLGGWLIEMEHSAPTIPFIEALRCHKLLSSPRWPSWWLKPGLFPWFSTSWTWTRRTKPFFNLQNDQNSLIRLSATCHNLHRIWRMPWISTFFGSSALCLAFWCCLIMYLP